MLTLRELKQKRSGLVAQARSIVDKAEQEARDLTQTEAEQYRTVMGEIEQLGGRIERLEAVGALETDTEQIEQRRSSADPSGGIGMTDQEIVNYSILRAIRAAAAGDWRMAPLEAEASAAVAKQLGHEPHTFFVPSDVTGKRPAGAGPAIRMRTPIGWQYRDLTKAGDGGNLIATDLLIGSFIDMLRNRLVLQRAGARVLTQLVGDIDIPRQTGGATAYWVAEGNAPTKSDQGLEHLNYAPLSVAAYTEISRKMLKQSSRDAEQFVRDDLMMTLAMAVDKSGLHGTGTTQPTGIAITTGVYSVTHGDAGGPPSWGKIVEFETGVATANADEGTLAYIVNAKTRGALKMIPIGQDQRMIWQDGPTPLNGYAAFVTQQVRSDLTKGGSTGLSAGFFGNWADLLIAMWGEIDVLVNPYALDTVGGVRVTVFQDVDIKPRHAESFAVSLDMDTSIVAAA